jgi:molybdate transport system substrate-binding protein
MRVDRLGTLAAVGLMSLLAQGMTATAAEIKAFVTGAARPAFQELGPQFERATGHKLVSEFGLPPALIRKIEAGEPFDVLVMSYDVEGLIKEGKLAAGSRTVLGRYGIGIAIPQGAPKPDVSSVEAFKRSLLDAKAITTSGEGSSGRYVATMLDRMGIGEQVKPKIKTGPAGSAARFLAQREVDFAVIGLPPVIGVAGVEWAGLIPDELQHWALFSAGLSASAKEPAAGRELLRFFQTPEAAAVFKSKGLDPP